MTDSLTYHEGNDPDWFDAQYNLRAGRPDYEQTVIPGWICLLYTSDAADE